VLTYRYTRRTDRERHTVAEALGTDYDVVPARPTVEGFEGGVQPLFPRTDLHREEPAVRARAGTI